MFENNKKTFSFVAEVSGETDKLMHANHGGDMPVIMLRDNIFFPGTVSPITVGRKHSIKTLNKLERTDGLVALLTQKVPDVETPQIDDLYPIGVVAKLVHSMKMPDGTYNALFQAFNRIRIQELRQVAGSYEGQVVSMTDSMPDNIEQTEYKAMLALLKERTQNLMGILDDYPDELIHDMQLPATHNRAEVPAPLLPHRTVKAPASHPVHQQHHRVDETQAQD